MELTKCQPTALLPVDIIDRSGGQPGAGCNKVQRPSMYGGLQEEPRFPSYLMGYKSRGEAAATWGKGVSSPQFYVKAGAAMAYHLCFYSPTQIFQAIAPCNP